MKDFLNQPGILGTQAKLISDLTLILILITAVLFTIGWQLARHKHFEAHRWIQTVSVVINSIVVLVVMINSFLLHILPGIPAKLLEGSYGVTTFHAFVGSLGLILGIFVVLRGNELVPRGLKFRRYKLVMRICYALYMFATLIGVVVYYEAFVIGI